MCVIDWCSFSWQAFATLFTGIVAAAGAITIGLKQVGIARRQAEIADGQRLIASGQAATAQAAIEIAKAQALTARLAQRGNLFERRLKVYTTVQDYLQIALRGKFDGLVDLTPRVRDALNEARFLFPETVSNAFLEAFELADECALMIEDRRDGTKKAIEDPDRLRELRHKLRDILGSLSKTMGDEMVLFVTHDPTDSVAV